MFWLCTCVIIINITGFKSTILLLFFVPFFFWFLFLYFTVFFWVEYNSIFLHHSLVGLISFLYVSVVILHFTIYIFNIPQFYFKWYNTSCKIYDCYEIINSSAQFFELLSYFTSTYQKPHDKLWRRQWHPTPVLLPGKSHGRRRLVVCSPQGR